MAESDGLHRGLRVLETGTPLHSAQAAMILVHGRGASALDILGLAAEWDAPGMVFLAPQAANGTWYPNRFIAPVASNEPWLGSALGALGDAIDLAAAAGIELQRTLLLGFSQGGCLALEYVARHALVCGGVIGKRRSAPANSASLTCASAWACRPSIQP